VRKTKAPLTTRINEAFRGDKNGDIIKGGATTLSLSTAVNG
jgi:hypothetical protein